MTDQQIIDAANNSSTMAKAAESLGISLKVFKGRATKLGVYRPNQGGKGINGEHSNPKKFPLNEILEGKFPEYQSVKLKVRLIREGVFEDKCYECGWAKKRDDSEFTTCELHHINGNPRDHRLANITILCPNCHSLTPNFRNLKRS